MDCGSIRGGQSEFDLKASGAVCDQCFAVRVAGLFRRGDDEVLIAGAHRGSEFADSAAVQAHLNRVGALVLTA